MSRNLIAIFAAYFMFNIPHCLHAQATVSGPAVSGPGLIRSEFIYETAPFPSCHASTIVETTAGLVAAWFGGTDEMEPDVGIWVSRSVDENWTPPVEVVNGVQSADTRFPCWNPVLFQPRTGPLMLFYKVGPNPRAWWGMVVTSDNAGRSWSNPRRLPDGILGPIKNKPIQLANGDIISPSSTEHDGYRVHFERSADLGKTWEATAAVNDGRQIRAIQPSLLILKDGRMQAMGRTNRGSVFEIFSSDAGRTWGEMTLSSLPNPNSGIDATTLADGRHLIVYNHSIRDRSPLNIAVSLDGATWQAALVLENQPGEYSYPAVIQSRDGLVHVTYTWKRERIRHSVVDPRNLDLRPIENGKWPE